MEQVGISVRVEVDPASEAPPPVNAQAGADGGVVLLEPAASVIRFFGGLRAVARICGVDPSRVYRWQRAADAYGTGGLIPQRHHSRLIEYAQRNGLAFNPLMLIRMPSS